MTNAATTIASHQTATKNGKILGCITYWSLRGFSVPRADFKAELATMGLDAAYGRDMSPKAVLTRAVDGWLRGRKDLSVKRLKAGVALLRSRVENGKVVTTHVWTASPLPNGTIAWDHIDAAGAVSGAATADMRSRLEGCFQEVIDYASTSDLSAALTTAMQGTRKAPMLSACNLRGEAGGVYFVPAASLPTFEKLRGYIMQNSSSDVSRFWISDVQDNAAEVQQNVKQTVESELADLRGKVLEFAKECADGSKDVGLKTINARAKRYDDLSTKVDLWADMLGDLAGEMRTKIAEASASLKADLGVATAPESTPAPAPAERAPAPVTEEPEPQPEEPQNSFAHHLEEGDGIVSSAISMAAKIRGAGFGAEVHSGTCAGTTVAAVEIADHPVMGAGLMIMRTGEAPEFLEGSFESEDIEAALAERLAA